MIFQQNLKTVYRYLICIMIFTIGMMVLFGIYEFGSNLFFNIYKVSDKIIKDQKLEIMMGITINKENNIKTSKKDEEYYSKLFEIIKKSDINNLSIVLSGEYLENIKNRNSKTYKILKELHKENKIDIITTGYTKIFPLNNFDNLINLNIKKNKKMLEEEYYNEINKYYNELGIIDSMIFENIKKNRITTIINNFDGNDYKVDNLNILFNKSKEFLTIFECIKSYYNIKDKNKELKKVLIKFRKKYKKNQEKPLIIYFDIDDIIFNKSNMNSEFDKLLGNKKSKKPNDSFENFEDVMYELLNTKWIEFVKLNNINLNEEEFKTSINKDLDKIASHINKFIDYNQIVEVDNYKRGEEYYSNYNDYYKNSPQINYYLKKYKDILETIYAEELLKKNKVKSVLSNFNSLGYPIIKTDKKEFRDNIESVKIYNEIEKLILKNNKSDKSIIRSIKTGKDIIIIKRKNYIYSFSEKNGGKLLHLYDILNNKFIIESEYINDNQGGFIEEFTSKDKSYINMVKLNFNEWTAKYKIDNNKIEFEVDGYKKTYNFLDNGFKIEYNVPKNIAELDCEIDFVQNFELNNLNEYGIELVKDNLKLLIKSDIKMEYKIKKTGFGRTVNIQTNGIKNDFEIELKF